MICLCYDERVTTMETAYARHVLPILEQQLQMYKACNRQLQTMTGQQNSSSLLLDIIGVTELKLAHANALIHKEQYENEKQKKQKV